MIGTLHTPSPFELPSGSCDCHVHVFGTHEEYPFAADRPYMPSPASVDDLLAMHRALGIGRVVIVQASPQGFDNRCLLASIAESNRRGHPAAGVAVVPLTASRDELEQLHAGGVRGLRVNLQSYGNDDIALASSELMATVRLAASIDAHVQIYTNLGTLAALEPTIRSLPVPLVIDHFALATAEPGVRQQGFDTLVSLVRSGIAYVKLSAPYRILGAHGPETATELVRSLIDADIERMLWGTDWPHTGARPGIPRWIDRPEPFLDIDDGVQLGHFGCWTSAAEREQILVHNAARLYRFSTWRAPE